MGGFPVSPLAENAVARRAALAPGVELPQKPFTPVSLARTVRETLDRHG